MPLSSGALSGHNLDLNDNTGANVNSVHFSNDGDWAARNLTTNGFASYTHYGWEWYAAHDGLGSSLELINPNLPNTYAQDWGSSTTLNGTPGQPNSMAATNIAPIIRPMMPRK